jgi:ribose 5-phosphate isomerase A
MTDINPKKIAAEKAVTFIKDGMTVGLGTGSTAYWAIKKIGERVKDEGLGIKAIATSESSEKLARELDIPVYSFAQIDLIDVTIDGADEADEQLNLIKGGGGALLREKIVASNTINEIIIVDESKFVKTLGKFPLPVEVNIFGHESAIKKLQQLGCSTKQRMKEEQLFITDNNNYIIDCSFEVIEDARTLHDKVNAITGVVDNGLFIDLAHTLIIAYNNGETKVIQRNRI